MNTLLPGQQEISLDDLLKQQELLQQMIEQKKVQAREQDLARVVQLIKTYSFAPSEIINALGWEKKTVMSAFPKNEVEYKYQNEDGSKKWSGRGIEPKWVTEYLAKKKTNKKEDLLIKKEEVNASA